MKDGLGCSIRLPSALLGGQEDRSSGHLKKMQPRVSELKRCFKGGTSNGRFVKKCKIKISRRRTTRQEGKEDTVPHFKVKSSRKATAGCKIGTGFGVEVSTHGCHFTVRMNLVNEFYPCPAAQSAHGRKMGIWNVDAHKLTHGARYDRANLNDYSKVKPEGVSREDDNKDTPKDEGVVSGKEENDTLECD